MSSGDEGRWFPEREPVGIEQRTQMRGVLYEGRSPYQLIRVLDTFPFGRALVLDQALQTTEADEFIYHEMIVHPALASLPAPQRVLIIGGGDGGCLRRVLEHPVQRAVMVEIDGQVIEVCRRYLPSISAGAFDDPRAEIVLADGCRYVREAEGPFDAVLIDSTDPTPTGPSRPLFSPEFYRDIRRLLREDGFLVSQSGSPIFRMNELLMAVLNMRQVFPLVLVYLAPVPSYPGVVWAFTIASAGPDPREVEPSLLAERLRERGIATAYYSPELHRASFALPAFLARTLEEPQRFQARELPHPVTYEALERAFANPS